MTAKGFKKSTTVRTMRGAFRVLERLAPGLGARTATRLWFRVPAPVRIQANTPEAGTPFQVAWEGHQVRGRTWGDGPNIYLVHGWGGRGRQLSAFVEPLVAAGHRVVLFDAPSHGASDAGDWGPRSTHGVEMGKALDAVAAEFGPARAVVAHSLGAVATMLALRHGWLGTERLVFLAPISAYADAAEPFRSMLALGRRTSSRFDAAVWRRVGIEPDDFDLRRQVATAEPAVPTLVVHDRDDRATSALRSIELAERFPNVRLVLTSGLGHNRLLADPDVVAEVADFVGGGTHRLHPAVSLLQDGSRSGTGAFVETVAPRKAS